MTVQHRAVATLSAAALQHNFTLARTRNPRCHIVAVIKANGYGHGMEWVAGVLAPLMGAGDCFGVASLEEGRRVQRLGTGRTVLLMEGALSAEEFGEAVAAGFHQVVHASWQLELVRSWMAAHPDAQRTLNLWLKLDTGMHRLGMTGEAFCAAHAELASHAAVGKLVLMTHLACADDPVSPATQRQLTHFNKVLRQLSLEPGINCELSVAASAGILGWPQTHFQWLRPGIMLYGGSPILRESGPALDLHPVMTLAARLIAIKTVEAGGAIGYGAAYVCPHPQRIGVVSIGYGDGYPRNAPNGTPVLVKCAANIVGQPRRTRLIGRVSMDMLTIDLNDIREAAVGDEVILWGEGLPADEVAAQCGTISYELFCRVTARVHFTTDQDRV
jgi:alanine racemase